jgi:hypothetical protein
MLFPETKFGDKQNSSFIYDSKILMMLRAGVLTRGCCKQFVLHFAKLDKKTLHLSIHNRHG